MDRNELVSFISVKTQLATLLLATSVWGLGSDLMIGDAAADRIKLPLRGMKVGILAY